MTEAEFERFHAETAGPLHAYLSRVGGGESLADDLVQTAYVRFLTAPHRPVDPKARTVYLFRIARNLMRDEFRRRGKERDARDAPECEEQATSGLSYESRVEVRRAFLALSRRDRELLWLACVLGLSHREIAEVTDIGAASVRVLLFRARGRFSQMLDGRGLSAEDLT